MHIRYDEMTTVLKNRIRAYKDTVTDVEKGRILQIGDKVVHIYGLDNCMEGEMILFPNGVKGIALNLEEDNVGCVLFSREDGLKEGDEVRTSGKLVEVAVGEEMLGRVVDPLGRAIDGKGEIKTKESRAIEMPAPGIMDREPINEPLLTGIKAVDSMVPIGKGQRELIIGDRRSGKTAICIDTILNQKDKDVICVYVAIGKKKSEIVQLHNKLKEKGAMDYTVIVSSSASDVSAIQYIAPFSGCSIAEYFMYKGKDVLIVYDDLSKHAVAYRTISLLLRRSPGREAYPGDIFYLHSRLLERAAKLSKELGGGSLTAIPIVETLESNISAYIPTNVISITDGQVFLNMELFNKEVRPAISVGESVSRLGGNAQHKCVKEIASLLRIELAQYRELESFAQFSSEVDKEVKKKIEKGKRLVEILKQKAEDLREEAETVAIIYCGINDYLSDIDVELIKAFEKEYLEYMNTTGKEVLDQINKEKTITTEIEEGLKHHIKEFKKSFIQKYEKNDKEKER